MKISYKISLYISEETVSFKNCKKAELYCPIVVFLYSYITMLLNSAIIFFQHQPLYNGSTLLKRQIPSTSLSFRFLYQAVFYCLVCIVSLDLLCVECIVFVRVKNHLYFNQSIDSLKLKEFNLHIPPQATALKGPLREVEARALVLSTS